MPVNIHGKQYKTVAERIQDLHETVTDKTISITTEFLPIPDYIVCKATINIGDNVFTGTSAADPSKTIEKQSPYEVAETSAIGRALGFAGFGIVEGIATADEIVKVDHTPQPTSQPVQPSTMATPKQLVTIHTLLPLKGRTTASVHKKFGVEHTSDLTLAQASQLIDALNKMPDVEEKVNPEDINI